MTILNNIGTENIRNSSTQIEFGAERQYTNSWHIEYSGSDSNILSDQVLVVDGEHNKNPFLHFFLCEICFLVRSIIGNEVEETTL